MQPYPFFYPSPFRPPYSPYPYRKKTNFVHNVNNAPKAPSLSNSCNTNSSHNTKEKESIYSDCTNTEECFEIFGLKLYFDDLLILALLFFLYQEEVKDTYLYMALILLLLS